MALVGAYVLAGCLVTHENDLPRAFQRYETEMRPFADSAQRLGPGVPGIATPHSERALWITTTVIATVGWFINLSRMAGIGTVLSWAFWPFSLALRQVGWLGGVESMPLPKYETMKTM